MWPVVSRRRRGSASTVCACAALATWVGCSQSVGDPDGLAAQDGPGGAIGGSSSPGTQIPFAGNGGANSGGEPPLPPERELENTFRLPVQSGRWVWAANPESSRVAVIDTESLSVELARAGFAPAYLAALPARGDVLSAAIVLNEKSHDATVMRLTASGVTTHTVPTHAGANAWTVSPSGRWAIAWTSAAAIPNADRADSFQDITVIDVEALSATRLSVGYRPSRVFVRDDEKRAFVVCEPGISVLSLDAAGPGVSEDIPLSDAAGARAVDVAVVPDGTYAVARAEGSSDVSVVDLGTGERTVVPLSGPVTDLDLVADGSAAIAVVRGQPPMPSGIGNEGGSSGIGGGAGVAGAESGAGSGGVAGAAPAAGGSAGDAEPLGGMGGEAGAALSPPSPPAYGRSQIAVLSIPDVIAHPHDYASVMTDELVGSVAVSERGSVSVLYTTVAGFDRIVVLPTSPGTPNYFVPRAVGVRAPVESVFIAPDDEHALVSLKRDAASTVPGAFGVVPLGSVLPVKFHTTDAPVAAVAFAPAPTTSAVVTSATGRTVYVVHMPSLLVDPVALPSLPLTSGVIKERNEAFVVQRHPEGRLTLIDLETADTRTLTGFELAAGATP